MTGRTLCIFKMYSRIRSTYASARETVATNEAASAALPMRVSRQTFVSPPPPVPTSAGQLALRLSPWISPQSLERVRKGEAFLCLSPVRPGRHDNTVSLLTRDTRALRVRSRPASPAGCAAAPLTADAHLPGRSTRCRGPCPTRLPPHRPPHLSYKFRSLPGL